MISFDVADANSQVIDVILDDELFHVILNWNSSNQSWTWGLRNANYDALIVGVALVPNFLLLKQFRYPRMPKGDLIVLSAKDRNGPIPRDGFIKNDYEFDYITEEEVKKYHVV